MVISLSWRMPLATPLWLCACACTGAWANAPAPAPAPSSAMAGELQRAAERGNMCSTREAVAAGLRAEYFSRIAFAGAPALSRLEGPVELMAPGSADQLKAPVRSARWRGWIRPPLSGEYGFVASLPGARITVAGQTLLGPRPGELAVSRVALSAGRYHPISVELSDWPRSAEGIKPMTLQWITPHGARYLIPKTVMYPPSDTVSDRKAAAPSSKKP